MNCKDIFFLEIIDQCTRLTREDKKEKEKEKKGMLTLTEKIL